jgi:hypothetical protein
MFNGLTVLSLVLCLATVALWVRSYYVGDGYRRLEGSHVIGLRSANGVISFHATPITASSPRGELRRIRYWRSKPYNDRPDSTDLLSTLDPGLRSARSVPGIAWRFTDGGYGPAPIIVFDGGTSADHANYHAHRDIYLSHWLAVSLFVLLPATWLVPVACRRRFPPGHCEECGYALKGNVSGVCPECGTVIA